MLFVVGSAAQAEPQNTGQDIDIATVMYVAETPNDYDGDGILNEDEACLTGEPAGVDVDKDGIDDACDGFIDEAPVVPDPMPEPDPNPAPESEEKELIVSESMPDWLLQIEKELAAAQAIVEQPITPTPVIVPQPIRRQTSPLSQSTTPTVIEQSQTSSQPPATQVAGVSSAVETLPVEQKSSFNAWYVVPILFLVVLLGGAWRRYANARY